MVHVSNIVRSRNEEERKRLLRVFENWRQLIVENPLLKTCHVLSEQLARTSRNIGDERTAPFVKDMIELGFTRDDTVMLTNGDAHICRDVFDVIRRELPEGGALCSNRRDFYKPCRHWLSTEENKLRGKDFEGLDCFIITKEWWKKNRDAVPDLLMGFQCWDWVMKFIINHKSSIELTYHEFHTPYWTLNKQCPGQLWNRKLTIEWMDKHPQFIPQWPHYEELKNA